MNTELSKNQATQLPAFMETDSQEGTVGLGKFIVPPRIKVVQSQSGEQFTEHFNKGDVIIVPQMIEVAPIIMEGNRPSKHGTPFHFVPIFFFPEWCIHNPIALKGKEPFIRDRSLDENSSIAAKARNKSLREEPCPGHPTEKITYAEHLNFMCLLLGEGPTAGLPVLMTFFRGSHRSGSTLASLIKMRKAPIFGCIFEGVSTYTSNEKGQWYAINVVNPSLTSGYSGFVTDEQQYNVLKQLHLELKDAHANMLLRPDYEDEIIDEDKDDI